MYKRELKPQVKVILIILGVILALIVLENFIKLINSGWKSFMAEREYNKQQEMYEQTPVYEEEKYVADSVEKTIKYINEENYEELFALLDPEYKEVFAIDSVEKFKEIIKEYIGDSPKDVTLLDYGMQNGRYICSVAIQKEGVLENKQILVTPLVEDEFYIVLDNVRTIEKFDNVIYTLDPEVEYNLKYTVVKDNERILVFDVKNKTKNNMVGSYESTLLQKTDRVKYPLQNVDELKNIELPANQVVRLSFAFDNKDSYIYPDEVIFLNLLLNNGTQINKKVMLEVPDEY